MEAFLTALITTACLWAILVWIFLIVSRLKNRSLMRPSPTQSTTPTPTSDELVLKMMETMSKTYSESTKEMHQMVVDLTQGRESASPTGTPETSPIWNERPIAFDYDSTPLSPGIEGVLAREEEESEQARLLRERDELQRQVMERQEELDRFDLEQSSESGPWNNGAGPKHAAEPPT